MREGQQPVSRVTRSKAEARDSYNRLARWYDLLAGSSEQPYVDQGLQLLDAQAGEKILEIGFGTGHALLALARAVGAEGRVYGIDLADRMVAIATERLAEAGLAGRVELTRGDATHLPYAPEMLDGLFMSFTLELFDTPEIPIVLQECHRVLRPGGRIVVVGLSKKGGENVMTRLYEWAHRAFPTYIDCRPISIERDMRAAGFDIVQGHLRSMWGLPVETVLARSPD